MIEPTEDQIKEAFTWVNKFTPPQKGYAMHEGEVIDVLGAVCRRLEARLKEREHSIEHAWRIRDVYANQVEKLRVELSEAEKRGMLAAMAIIPKPISRTPIDTWECGWNTGVVDARNKIKQAAERLTDNKA